MSDYIELGSVAEFVSDRIDMERVNKQNYISTENMIEKKGGILSANSLPTSKTVLNYKPKDILISNIRLYFEKIWFADKEGGSSADVLVLRTKKGYSPKFIYYALSDSNFFKYADVTSKGTKMPRGDKKAILKYIIPDYPVYYQTKIADVLSTYDKLIENNNRRIQILEQTAEELYKEWFVRMRFPGYEKTKFDKGIPEGWEVKKLNEFSELVQGYTEKANDNPVGPKYLRGTDINKKSYITWSEVPYCTINETNYKKHKLQIEDIVIIRMADPGKVAVIEENVEAVFASYLIKINYDKSKVLPYYLFYTLYGKGYQSQIQSYANGTTRSSINSKMILNSSVLLPPKEIQMLFNERVLKYRKLLNQFINQNQNLIKQRDLLLPRLMNGTITVK